MGIRSFCVGVRHTVNLGGYESMQIEARVELDCEDENFATMKKEAQESLRTLLSDTFHGQKRPAWFDEIPSKRRK